MAKRMRLTVLIVTFLAVIAHGQPDGPLTYGKAPAFMATSTMGLINFPEDYYGKWKIIFSHPADFTPVCTSEIMELARREAEFRKLKTQILVLSTDGLNSHIEWVKSMEGIAIEGKNQVRITFPLIADADLVISTLYGILQKDSAGRAYDIRSVFFIDPQDNIRATLYYPSSVGRSIPEILRILHALQTEDDHGVLIPVNWEPGEDVMLPSPGSVEESQRRSQKKDPKLYHHAWYMWYRKL
jgi:peroxiredoxin 2/4